MFVLPSAQNFNFSATGKLANGLNKIESEKISLYTANQPRLTVNNLGNVGIGTTNPDTQLHLTGDLRVDGATNLGTLSIDNLTVTNSLTVQGTTTSINTNNLNVDDPMIRLANANAADITDIGFYGMYIDTGVTKFRGLIHDASDNAWKLFDNETTEPTTTMTFGNTPLLTVTNSGQIGIGTDNPAELLDINGNIQVRGNILPDVDVAYDLGTTGQRFRDLYLSGSSINLGGLVITNKDGSLGTGNGDNTILSGNVGIGTNTPGSLLHVHKADGNGSFMQITNSDTGTSGTDGFIVGIDNTENAFIFHRETNGLYFGTDNTERMRITSAGNVGIGTNNPLDKLQIAQADLGLRFAIANGTYYTEMGQYTTIDPNYFIINARGNSASFGTMRFYCNLDGTTANQSYVHHSKDRWAFVANNTELFRIQETGEVGIGTNNPSQELHIYKSSSGSATQLRIDNPSATASSQAALALVSDSGSFALRCYSAATVNSGAVKADGNLIFSSDTSSGGLGIVSTSGNMRFYTGGTSTTDTSERMVILDGGNVGIGTNNPEVPFHMYDENGAAFGSWQAGTLTIDPVTSFGTTLSVNRDPTDGTFIASARSSQIDVNVDRIRFAGTTSAGTAGNSITYAEHMRIENSTGNVGIGTNNPAKILDIRKDQNSASTLRVYNNTSGTAARSEIQLQANSGTCYFKSFSAGFTTSGSNILDSAQIYADDALSNGLNIVANNVITFWTGGTAATDATERMRIVEGGNIGIGTAVPSRKVHLHKGDSGEIGLLFTNTTTGTTVGNGFEIGIDSNENAFISQKESQSIFFEAQATQRVQINNNSPYAYKTSGGSWGTLSDRRIKQNEREITDSLGKICALKPKHFEYINIGVTANPEGTRTGFIAQDFEEVFPGHITEIEPMVEEDKEMIGQGEKIKAIDADLIPYLVGAVKQLKDEKDALQQQVVDMGVTIAYLLSQH